MRYTLYAVPTYSTDFFTCRRQSCTESAKIEMSLNIIQYKHDTYIECVICYACRQLIILFLLAKFCWLLVDNRSLTANRTCAALGRRGCLCMQACEGACRRLHGPGLQSNTSVKIKYHRTGKFGNHFNLAVYSTTTKI